ncbi:hypothetical protein BU26DRAFT_537813 [Trematosphaeria pertusa]|uniref:DNA damage-responsive protein 48 n=1 Tax=Trematosphaeria pertusa TaxID=390896 RepID=A0A6A6J1X1_9PLEO|nr:uncharacterized protein BU26DRAFT_537813 [Trematosphaeria pertusa]KAF2255463.1 hypothetical protein BU26DRAFT_537813 [Trematosphaeria pertusa]
MDYLNKFTGGDKNEQQQQQQQGSSEQKQEGGGFLSGLGNKMNEAGGGGAAGEKNEDMLDKGIDFVQEKFLGAGKQDNESAVEQAKDEQISDFIRGRYKGVAGSDMPIKDKPTTFDKSTD